MTHRRSKYAAKVAAQRRDPTLPDLDTLRDRQGVTFAQTGDLPPAGGIAPPHRATQRDVRRKDGRTRR